MSSSLVLIAQQRRSKSVHNLGWNQELAIRLALLDPLKWLKDVRVN